MPKKSATLSVADENAAPGGAAAVDRALSLLRVFQRGDQALSVTELAQRARLHKSTVLRLLQSLAHAGMLQRTEHGLWRLGPELSRLASLYWASFDLESVLKPEMKALVQRTHESVSFHVRQGQQRLVLLRVDSPQLLRDHTRQGDLVPLDRGAGGRVLMAFTGAEGEIYEQIREDGYALVRSDRIDGVSGISAPVWNATGKLVGALTLTFPDTRMQPRFVGEILASTQKLNEALGAGLVKEG